MVGYYEMMKKLNYWKKKYEKDTLELKNKIKEQDVKLKEYENKIENRIKESYFHKLWYEEWSKRSYYAILMRVSIGILLQFLDKDNILATIKEDINEPEILNILIEELPHIDDSYIIINIKKKEIEQFAKLTIDLINEFLKDLREKDFFEINRIWTKHLEEIQQIIENYKVINFIESICNPKNKGNMVNTLKKMKPLKKDSIDFQRKLREEWE